MGEVVERERLGAVLRLWLNRPEVENALNDAIYAGVLDALQRATADPEIGAIIITGRGTAFSRSADGDEIGEKYFGSREAYRGFLYRVRDFHTAIQSVPKPVIAAVNGVASMGGIELALACDFIVASSEAKLGDCHPGGVGGGGASQTLREAVGARMTRWLLYTGELLDARRALEVGLVQQVLPAQGFQEAVVELANRIVARRFGDSLARVKALTVPRDPTPADRELEIGHSIEHYFDPRIQTGLDDQLASDRAKTG
ncbi:MAG: enoyl-CoA hydratase/isomerase family protein [Myxococcota bacterium]